MIVSAYSESSCVESPVAGGESRGESQGTLTWLPLQTSKSQSCNGPYTEVARLYGSLSEVVDPDTLGVWFNAPNEAFAGLKPVEVIERGEIDRLWQMVHRLRSGIPG